MSIYATWLYFHDDPDDPCNDLGAPYLYRGSHILPSLDDERGGYVEVAAIPNYIVREGRADGGPGLHDWLRVSVGDGKAVLNRAHVQRLRDTLTEWLDRSPDPNEG